MIVFLRILFSAILAWMLIMTTMTSLELNLFTHLPVLLRDPWAVATLWDAYFGFLTFYIWVYYKESGVISRILWFIGIMLLGNITMALYMLIELFKVDKNASVEDFLVKKLAKN